MTFALGIAAAVLASMLFNGGVLLQALEARREPASRSLRLSLLGRLLRRPRWLIGTALGLAGVGPQLVALALAPFVVVQPALSVGLLMLLAVGSRVLGEPVGAAEWFGVLAIIAGVALVCAGAPTHVEAHRGGLAVIAVAGVPALLALVPFAVRGTRLDRPALVIAACGLGFTAANIATKLLGDDVGLRHYPNAVAWGGIALAAGIAATITNMTAFQRTPATIVVPVTTAAQTFLPIVFEPLFLRERWGSALDGILTGSGLIVAAIGVFLVSRTGAVSRLAASAQ